MPPIKGRRPTLLTVAAGWRGARVSLLAGTILAALACPNIAVANQGEASSTTDQEGSREDSWDVRVS
jgi:hypothetical protein